MTRRGMLLLLIVSLAPIACQKDGGTGDKSASQLVEEGWGAFAAGDYQTAYDRCNEAIGMDASLADAYNGAGWAGAKLNSLAAAVTKFNNGLARDPSNLEMKAGLAFVLNAQKNYVQSIPYAVQVIQANPTWSFSRKSSISAPDVRLLLAENYFDQSIPDYVLSLQQVQILNPLFTADVATAAGVAALAKEIERLRPVV
jgi:tetratricopeptide (TPR) repeat protein